MQSFDFGFLWLAFVGLFAIVNPFSTALVFLGLSGKNSERQRRNMARKASITSALILIFFMISGTLIFNIFSITLEAFQIAGGLLISIIGFHMLYPRSKLIDEEKKESIKKEDISIIPLAIPMLSGPGAITTALVWTSQATSYADRMGLLAIAAIISIISYFVLINATYFKRVVGHTGTGVIERLMGLIVLVMGIQFIINALKVIIPYLT